jgi:hypothetical protein
MRSRRVGMLAALIVTLGALGSGVTPAVAGSCADNTICTFDLLNSNVTELSPIDVRVTWDNTGATTTLSVQWISGGPGTPKFINEFGYNSDVAVTSTSAGTWTASSNQNIDGFGTFATDEQNAPPENLGVSSPITFTLASTITDIPVNGNGAEFVAHVGGYASGCSGFVSDGTASGTSSNPTCGGTNVSEPGTAGPLALIGFGLVSVGALLRKRWSCRWS